MDLINQERASTKDTLKLMENNNNMNFKLIPEINEELKPLEI